MSLTKDGHVVLVDSVGVRATTAPTQRILPPPERQAMWRISNLINAYLKRDSLAAYTAA
jgi:hypothetical protein